MRRIVDGLRRATGPPGLDAVGDDWRARGREGGAVGEERRRGCGLTEGRIRCEEVWRRGLFFLSLMRQIRLQRSFALVACHHLAASAGRAGYSTAEAFKAEVDMAPSQFANLAAENGWQIRPRPVPGQRAERVWTGDWKK